MLNGVRVLQGSWGEGTLHGLGDERRRHGAEQRAVVELKRNLGAERASDAGLAAFDLNDEKLRQIKMSADEKSLIAALVRAETVVRASWVAEQLRMGSVANATRASKAIEHSLEGAGN